MTLWWWTVFIISISFIICFSGLSVFFIAACYLTYIAEEKVNHKNVLFSVYLRRMRNVQASPHHPPSWQSQIIPCIIYINIKNLLQ